MLRTVASRLVQRAPAPAGRQLSTTPSLLVRIRSSNSSGGTSNPNPSQPSPAEAPLSPPPETSTPPPPFEPEVHQASPTASTQTNADPSPNVAGETGESNTPLTPPSAEAAAEAAAGEGQAPKDGKYTLPSLDIDPEVALPEPAKEGDGSSEGSTGRRRTGAGRKEYVSSIERQRQMWIRMGMGAAAVAALGAAWYSSQGEVSDSTTSTWERMKTNASEFFDVFNKPAFKTLLPDPLPPPHQRPYTLVIDLEGLLVSSSWDRTTGWRTAKRPGVDYFLAYLSQFYEIVLFSSQPMYTAMPVAEKLDPFTAYLPYRLYRDSTRYVGGKAVKDLSYLNRDLSKVILLDTTPESSALQPENAIVIKPWEGKGGERGLVDLIPFLESIGIFSPPDVRPILKAYEGKDIPSEYAKKEAESKRAAIEEWERKNPASRGGGGGFMGGMFGSVSPGAQSRPNQPMTYLEQKRAQAQKMYQEEQKYWAEHAEEFKKLIEEDKQRQLAEMKGSLIGWIQGAGGAPPPEQKTA